VARGYASLSGIHNGIRRSERVRPQGARLADDGKPLTYRERQQARREAPKPEFKIRRGKKDITEYPDAPKPQSRRARFFDPESSFGKKSLVYQLKSGKLKEELSALQDKEPKVREILGDVFDRTFGGPEKDPREASRSGRGSRGFSGRSGRGSSRGAGEVRASGGRSWSERDVEGSRGSRSTRRGAPTPTDPRAFSREFERRPPRKSEDMHSQDARPPRELGRGGFEAASTSGPGAFSRGFAQMSSREPEDMESQDARPPRGLVRRDYEGASTSAPRARFDSSAEERPRREQRDHRDIPVSIPYTTAASQFLYGKSVVEAALQGGRRQLYKLYIYRGRNVDPKARGGGLYSHIKTSQDASIERLALAKKVQIIKLGDEGLRLMDKMSGGRPHNNYILEASPLPQLPVTGLGRLSETGGNPGFHVDLAHQSAEEIAVTGSSNFVATPASGSHKPLVVVLHGVLDPGNVGAILRSASFLGATAIATTKRGSAPLTPIALKAAAGASESLTLFTIESIDRFLEDSRENGWTVYAAVPPPANGKHPRPHMDMHELEEEDPLREKPCILILGSEGEGLGKQVLKKTDCDINIPRVLGTEMVDSLNVSVAAGLLCNAFLRGKITDKMTMEKDEEDKFSLF